MNKQWVFLLILFFIQVFLQPLLLHWGLFWVLEPITALVFRRRRGLHLTHRKAPGLEIKPATVAHKNVVAVVENYFIFFRHHFLTCITMLQFHCDVLCIDYIDTLKLVALPFFPISEWVTEWVSEWMSEWWEEGSVPGVVISGAVSAEKPDSQMAALSVWEVEGRGRGPAAPASITLKWTAWRY